ncbi:C1q-related factor-like [Betta splendens]|uniref:C1q-related factor-like n=1 Tax=Betta splendens TaxID=158456 RepID=A0A6P7PFI6_BETSP|nr:C1q-related factor-like [Betta splendens]
MRAIVLLCLLHGAHGYSWDAPGTNVQPLPDTSNVCLLDQASCGCCVIQKQLQVLERYIDVDISEMSAVLNNAKTTLNNIRASRSAFSVALSNSSSVSCYGPFAVNKPVLYQHVFINLGGSYSAATGVFTAPRSGAYGLAVTIYGVAAPGTALSTCASLLVNGQAAATLFEQNGQDLEDSSSAVVTVKLKAGAQVSVNLIKGCFVCDDYNHYNTFTGFLLYATD